MNSDNNEQHSDDDSSLNRRRIRRGPNRGRSTMPEPDNVLPSVTASAPTFRAMAIQNRGPQLMIPSAPSATKVAPSFRPLNAEFVPQSESKQQPTQQQKQQQQFVLNTESKPCFGWDFSQIIVQDLPMYFPRDLIQWEFLSKDLEIVLKRLSKQLRDSSVQACLSHEPLSAKLQTCHHNAELYLVFFNEPSGKVSMSVQRHKGCHMDSTKCIRRLVDAAKGILPEQEENKASSAVTANGVNAMERLIERCTAESKKERQDVHQHPFLNQTPEQMIDGAIRNVYGWLEQSRRLDLRRHALESLLAMTDLKRTLSCTAIATSLVVLQGKLPSNVSSDLDVEAQTIQSVILNILLTRELPGDRAMFAEAVNDTDQEMSPYFPEVDKDITTASTGLPSYYTDYMNELFNVALQILVQSLEVLSCFPELQSGNNNIAHQLFVTASQISDSKGLYHILLNCVCHAESKLANGYLACKALRLLASGHPGIKDQIKLDENAKQSIDNAYQVGQMRHTLLKIESYQLWQTVCQ